MDSVAHGRRTARIGVDMKIIFLCVLMTSILLAAFYGPPIPALRRLLLNR
jgi:hypothetical protein